MYIFKKLTGCNSFLLKSQPASGCKEALGYIGYLWLRGILYTSELPFVTVLKP